jgi:class 3 adenylate cyclase
MPDDPEFTELRDIIGARVRRSVARTLAGPELPTGTITILLTDIEGSTDLIRTLGDERARALIRRHDELLRQAIRESGGVEVERVGDSFMVAFPVARSAVACALQMQRFLRDDPDLRPEGAASTTSPVQIRVRMDTGEVIAEERGYFGATVIRASRIADLARGGRILASEATKVLAEQAGFRFISAGEHELRGLDGAHRVFELPPDSEQPALAERLPQALPPER